MEYRDEEFEEEGVIPQATPTQEYISYLLDELKLTSRLAKRVRMNFTKGEIDVDVFHMFMSNLLEVWLHVYPKVKNRDIGKRLAKYESFFINPLKLLEHPELVWELELLLREAYEELNLTAITLEEVKI